MQIQRIKEFLNENSCLSEAWKAKLLTLIEHESGVYQTPQTLSTKDFMDFIEPHEGKRNRVYTDTMGHPTIGIGFNLDRGDADSLLATHGLHKLGILRGDYMPDEVVYALFKTDVEEFIEKTKELAPSFEEQPREMKLVLVDMCFNLGKGGLSKFRKFLAAVEERNYSRAAAEMVDSKWYSQVGNRSKKLVRIVRSLV